MSRLVKGSPTARAWAKKMKKARIRAAGRRTEQQFFGPGGHFEDEAAAKQRKNHPPSWSMIVDYLKAEGWKPLGKQGVAAFGRSVRGLDQVLQLEARAWRVLYSNVKTFTTLSLGTYKDLDRALIAANRQASDYLGKKNNPRITQKRKLTVPQRHQLKIAYDTLKMSDVGALVMGGPNKEQAREIIKRLTGRTAKENPITLVGNPPKLMRTWSRIGARVEGVLYNKVLEIQAEKTGHHQHKGFWYHPFKKQSDVQLLALDTGDLLVHSKTGKKLWREDR